MIAEKLRQYLEGLALQAGASARAPLRSTLEGFLQIVEGELEPDVPTSILLLDEAGERLVVGAAPSLPAGYGVAIAAMAINPVAGARGTAEPRQNPVHVTDLAGDPRWRNFVILAAELGLRACWSSPIEGVDGKLAGIFAVYHRTLRQPTPTELGAMDLITRAASEVIKRHKEATDAGT